MNAVATPALRSLTSREASELLLVHGHNELPPPRREPLWRRFAVQLREPMSLLLLVAAIVSALGLGKLIDGAAIAAIVIVNCVIAVVQEGRATRALEALRAIEAPSSRVVRDGRVVEVLSRLVVPGDVVVLAAGDRIPADLIVIDASMLEVDESILTGESLAVPKSSGDALYSGTFVSRGTASGVVRCTGASTRLGAIAASLEEPPRATPLQRDLVHLSARLGVLSVIVASGVFVLTLARVGASREGTEQAFLSAVALAVAAVPEGLPTVVTLALALGVRRMAEHGAIVRRLPAVETLGCTTVLLSDKTGTLTENRMRVESVVPFTDSPEELALAMVSCNDATLDPPSGDPLEIALLESASPRVALRCPRIASIPFDSERKLMTTFHDTGSGILVVVKGAPEVVVDRCAGSPAGVLRTVSDMAAAGMRVLAFASRSVAAMPRDPSSLERDLTLLGLVGLRDPVRRDAARAVAGARGAGVEIVIVTGDHAGTAASVAAAVGIPSSPVVTGDELREGSALRRPLHARVYARVQPEDKLALTEVLQKNGEVVAVTGDGVNDAPALRRADIGVAMGRGSEVAREASDMIITDDNLQTIVTAVRQGRGIYDNIRKVVDYLVAGNLAEILVVVVGLIAFPALGVPLLPLQLLWINLLTDGVPALALGVDGVHPGVMNRRPRRRGARLLTPRRIRLLSARASLIAGAALGALAFDRFVWNEPWSHARSIMFTVLVFSHLLYAFIARLPEQGGRARLSPWLVLAVVAGVVLQVVAVTAPPLRPVFGTAQPLAREWALASVMGALPFVVMWLARVVLASVRVGRPGLEPGPSD